MRAWVPAVVGIEPGEEAGDIVKFWEMDHILVVLDFLTCDELTFD
jgi:hypothetical protein